MSESGIRWARELEPALVFHVLAHLDLGRDAASIFDETLPERAWVAGLREAYAAAPGRLQVHALGLRHREGLAGLRETPPPGLRDAAGRRLLEELLELSTLDLFAAYGVPLKRKAVEESAEQQGVMYAFDATGAFTTYNLGGFAIEDIDLVCMMSVNPGFGGQKFIENTYSKIIELRELIEEKNTTTLIEIDGGVDLKNAGKLIAAGADVLVAGNTVFSDPKPSEMIHKLKQLSNAVQI